MSTGSATSAATRDRLAYVDGLRGVAALLVLVFHAVEFSPGREDLLDALGPAATHWPQVGALAIDIFFLLSGFVLYRTLDRGTTSAGAFILRRQLRLDPAYWVALILTLFILAGEAILPGLDSRTFSPLDIVLNAAYLQVIFERPFILSVSWTLCLEVQLYLALLAIVVIGRRFVASSSAFVPAALFATGVSALAIAETVGPTMTYLWTPWPLFCGGALAYAGQTNRRWMYAAVGLFGLRAISMIGPQTDEIVPLALALATLAGWPFLVPLLSGAWIQWIGLRSYSVYLFHLAAIDLTTRPIYKLSESRAVSIAMAALSIATSLIVADLAFRFIERPCLRLSAASKTVPWRELLRRPSLAWR